MQKIILAKISLSEYPLGNIINREDNKMVQNSENKTVNVICIKWGTLYSADDINKLYSAIKRNTRHNVKLFCFTEIPEGLNDEIVAHPLPTFDVEAPFNHKKESGLCDDNLGGLNGQRVFFFDIDSLIVGNLDELFDYDYGDELYIINDWANRKGKKKNKVGQASCYTFVVGTLGYVKKYFEQNSEEVIKEFGTATQEYLSAKVIEKNGKLNFFPDNWFKSFHFHCMPNPLLRWLLPTKKPNVEGLKMIAFHGTTNIPDALKGVYAKKSKDIKNKFLYFIKKFYKQIKPAKWVEEYWK